jgi:hypothetical protein
MLYVSTNGNGFVVALIVAAFFAFVVIIPPIIGYEMIQSNQYPNWGWFLLVGYPIILIGLTTIYAWYKKITNHTHHIQHTQHHTQLLQENV